MNEKPRDSLGRYCAGASIMTSAACSTAVAASSSGCKPKSPPAVPTRRHLERPTRVWPFVMESLAEKNETDGDGSGAGDLQQPSIKETGSSGGDIKEKGTTSIKKSGIMAPAGQVDQPSVGCAPFFGVKHYLHNFYGLPDDETSAKIWRQIEAGNEEDYYAILTAGQSKNEMECWHVHRRCFAWSVSLLTPIKPEIVGLASHFSEAPKEEQAIGGGTPGQFHSPEPQPSKEEDEATRRQAWERGEIDYTGRDSFNNLMEKMQQTLLENTKK